MPLTHLPNPANTKRFLLSTTTPINNIKMDLRFFLLVIFLAALQCLHFKKSIFFFQGGSLACLPLDPTDGAVVYYPNHQVHPAQGDQIFANLTTLEDIRSVWQVSLCRTDGGGGNISIVRVGGCPLSVTGSPPLSPGTPYYLIQAASILGPDEYHVMLEGPELHFLWPVHLGNCSYRIPFRVLTSGLYRLLIIHLRDSWDSLEEKSWNYKPMTLDNLIGNHMVLNLLQKSDSTLKTCVTFPQIDKPPFSLQRPGRWVRKNDAPLFSAQLLNKPGPPPFSSREIFFFGGIGAQYYTDARKELEWIGQDKDYFGTTCRRPLLLNESNLVKTCLISKAVLFIGDSQMRFATQFFVQSVCGLNVTIKKSKDNYGGAFFVGPTCYGLTAYFMSSELGEHSIPKGGGLPIWDIIFANFGQHHISRVHIPVFVYEQLVESYVQGLLNFAEENPGVHIAWVETFPFNPSTHLFTIMHNDLRTYHRIKLHVLAALAVIEPYVEWNELGYIPVYDLFQPLADWADTTGHFTGLFEAAQELSWRFLTFICAKF